MLYTLEVTLERAEDLAAADFGFMGIGGKSDPYVVFKVDGVTRKSTTIPSTLNPVWNPPEVFRFTVDRPKEKSLVIHVFDRDRLNKDDLIGTTYVTLAPLLEVKEPELIAYSLDVDKEYANQNRNSALFLKLSLKRSNERVHKVLELWENQRYHIVKKWTYDAFINGSSERRRWSTVDNNKVSSDSMADVAPECPPHLKPEGWTLDVSQGDKDGWIYSRTFAGPWDKNEFALALVRRRKWINNCVAPDS